MHALHVFRAASCGNQVVQSDAVERKVGSGFLRARMAWERLELSSKKQRLHHKIFKWCMATVGLKSPWLNMLENVHGMGLVYGKSIATFDPFIGIS